jgi:hypothetical protein
VAPRGEIVDARGKAERREERPDGARKEPSHARADAEPGLPDLLPTIEVAGGLRSSPLRPILPDLGFRTVSEPELSGFDCFRPPRALGLRRPGRLDIARGFGLHRAQQFSGTQVAVS